MNNALLYTALSTAFIDLSVQYSPLNDVLPRGGRDASLSRTCRLYVQASLLPPFLTCTRRRPILGHVRFFRGRVSYSLGMGSSIGFPGRRDRLNSVSGAGSGETLILSPGYRLAPLVFTSLWQLRLCSLLAGRPLVVSCEVSLSLSMHQPFYTRVTSVNIAGHVL